MVQDLVVLLFSPFPFSYQRVLRWPYAQRIRRIPTLSIITVSDLSSLIFSPFVYKPTQQKTCCIRVSSWHAVSADDEAHATPRSHDAAMSQRHAIVFVLVVFVCTRPSPYLLPLRDTCTMNKLQLSISIAAASLYLHFICHPPLSVWCVFSVYCHCLPSVS